jgi:two-component system response regulator CpxR
LNINQVNVNKTIREVSCLGQTLELTGTEYLVLVYLMEQCGNIVSKTEISEQVLQRELSLYDRTIDVHVGNIRRKLIAIDTSNRIKTVRGAGYVFLQGSS